MRNFSELKSDVAVLAQRSGDTDYLAKIGVWLNLSQNFLFESYDYFNELGGIYSFTTVDGREKYPLPNDFDKPLRVFDLTNDAVIRPEAEQTYVEDNISAVADSTEGIPDKYRIFGVSGVTGNWLSTGSVARVKSSSSSDTAGCIVRIGGYLDSAGLIYDYEDITISTTTPETYVSGTKTFYSITEISKSVDTTGYLTVTDSTSVVMAYLSPTDRVVRNKVLRLGLIPGSAYSMKVYYKKRCRPMISDRDFPFMECDNYLTLDAWGWALGQEKETVERSMVVWKKSEEALMSILRNAAGNLGPDFQMKITSSWATAHAQGMR